MCTVLVIRRESSTFPLGDFNVHVENESGACKGQIGQHDGTKLNYKRKHLLQLCFNNALCMITPSNTGICTSTPETGVGLLTADAEVEWQLLK